jgi:site-specific recombinase XerD
MAGQGVPLHVLQALLGHADIKTTMRYVDVNEEQKRSAIAAVFGRGSHVAAEATE